MCANKERLDLVLLRKGLALSRSKARELILSGGVMIEEKVVRKPSFLVSSEKNISILSENLPRFVSRGGDKLEGAIIHFKSLSCFPILKDIVAVDFGSSKGGFTDCLLSHGAKKVYAVDVGDDQLDTSLRENKRVEVFENINLKHLNKEIFNPLASFAVVDLSFIGLSKSLPYITPLLSNNFFILALIKPQFELEKAKISKGGVVRKPELVLEAIEKVKSKASILNLEIHGVTESVLKGQKKLNQEFFILLSSGV